MMVTKQLQEQSFFFLDNSVATFWVKINCASTAEITACNNIQRCKEFK